LVDEVELRDRFRPFRALRSNAAEESVSALSRPSWGCPAFQSLPPDP
jgi:hypothetical protein